MKKYIIIGIIAVATIVTLGFIIPPPDGFWKGGTIKIPNDLLLKTTLDKILTNAEVDWIERKDCDDNELKLNCKTVINHGKIIQYRYISTTEVPQEPGEDISKRTKNGMFFNKGIEKNKEVWEGRFYAGEPFYKDEIIRKWYQTEIATTSIDAFKKQFIAGEIFGASPETYYAGAGDGVTQYYYNASWDTAHDAAASNYAGPTDVAVSIATGKEAAGFWISRTFFPIDTSGLPDDAIITSASFYGYVSAKINGDNDGDDWLNIIGQTTQADPTTLVVGDYDQCGAINNPTEGATRIDITNITLNQYEDWTFNATGLTWIKKTAADPYTMLGVREGHDCIDSPFGGSAGQSNTINLRCSEYTGTASDPYLVIAYTTAAPTVAPKVLPPIIIKEE